MDVARRRIMVVDDDVDILELLKYNLEKEGYDVLTLNRTYDAVSAARRFLPDLIILDIMMPDENGIDLCRKLRSKETFKDTYIFFLSARSETYYQHAALNTGGDDFIEKVIGIKTLTKRISAVLKRNFVIRKGCSLFRVGNLELNRNTSTASLGGQDILLSKPEFEVLFFFAQNPFKPVTLEYLVQSIWGSQTFMTDTNVEMYIHNLKRKLGAGIIAEQKPDQYFFKLT